MSSITKALASLRPGAEWRIEGDETLANLKWLSDDMLPPTQAEIDAEISRMAVATKWAAYQLAAQVELDVGDKVCNRCMKAGKPYPPDWLARDELLRAIVRAASGDPTQPLPARPAYPAGT